MINLSDNLRVCKAGVQASVEITDSMMKVKVTYPDLQGQIGTRGKVSEFSHGSRKRLFDFLNTVDWNNQALPLFFTATYGQAWPGPSEAKQNLELFFKRLRRRYPSVGVLWKMEPQGRGAPHFHMLIFGPTFIDKRLAQELWGQSIDQAYWDRFAFDQDKGPIREPFTRIEGMRSVRGVKWYVGKYIAKPGNVADPGDAGARAAWWSGPGRKYTGAERVGEAVDESSGFNSLAYLDVKGRGVVFPGRQWGIMGKRSIRLLKADRVISGPFGDWVAAVRTEATIRGRFKVRDSDSDLFKGFTLYFRNPEEREKWEKMVERYKALSKGSDADPKVLREMAFELIRSFDQNAGDTHGTQAEKPSGEANGNGRSINVRSIGAAEHVEDSRPPRGTRQTDRRGADSRGLKKPRSHPDPEGEAAVLEARRR